MSDREQKDEETSKSDPGAGETDNNEEKDESEVDETLEDTFPASDPPAW